MSKPTNGAVASGTITLEVDFVDPPSAIEQVTYFLDGDEFDNSEEVSATPVAGTDFERVVFRDRGNLPDTGRLFGLVGVTDPLP